MYHSEIDSPGKPHACSSPIAYQAKKGCSEIKVKNRIQRSLKIVNINFQSIKNKKPELDISKFGSPHFIQFHDKLLISIRLYIVVSIPPWQSL
jgi:hypothetical protein